MKKCISGVFCIIILLLGIQGILYAGITGKIRGKVSDAQTKEMLAGANVIITKVWINGEEQSFDENLGAACDPEGGFIILQVAPGMYTVEASMIGYTTSARQKVHVSADRTTIIDFVLNEAMLETEAVVVVASRDQIQLDVSATESYISSEEYQQTPFANRIEDVIGMQAGIGGNIQEDQISIRAGETREVGMLLDGMSMVDKKNNRPVFSVQPGMVEEIKIMRNGFNAEYGQSRSGIINVITKNPDDRIRVNLDYQYTPAQKSHYGRDKYDPNYRWEWRLLDGPAVYEGDTLYVPDGRYDRMYTWKGWIKHSEELVSDGDPNNDLSPQQAHDLWKWRHRPVEYGNLIGHNIDLSISGPLPLLPGKTNFLVGGKYENNPFAYPQSVSEYQEKIVSLKLINQVSPSIRLTLQGMHSEVNSVTLGTSTSTWSKSESVAYNGDSFNDYYAFYRPLISRNTSLLGMSLVHTLSPRLFYELNFNYFNVKWHVDPPEDSGVAEGRSYNGQFYYDPQSGFIPKVYGADDLASGFRMYGGAITWENSYNERMVLNAALTSQFHRAHELKAGINLNYDILFEDRTMWIDEDPSQEYIRQYKAEPIEVGMYLQDKVEFEGMVANLGVRLDYFNNNTNLPDISHTLDFASNREIYETFIAGDFPMIQAEPQYYVSPRLGISHPLSEYSKIYFNYGHFVQTPPSYQMYSNIVNGAAPSMQRIGNPSLLLEKTIAYELGTDIGIANMFQLHIGAFYKNYSDVAYVMTFAHTDQSLVVDYYDNEAYSEVRGIEVELRKSVGRFVTGYLNYNYIKKSKSNLKIPGLSENPIITDNPSIGINGVIWGVPQSDIINVVPNARGVITLGAPPGWGPEFFGYPFLANTNLNFQLFLSGR